MRYFLLYSLIFASLSPLFGQQAPPPEVALEAQHAVDALGKAMLAGDFSYGQKRIYPRWKRRLAIKVGGIDKLESHLAQARAKQKDFILLSFKTALPTRFFSVWPTAQKDSLGKQALVSHWLVIVPTTTRLRIADPQRGGQFRELEEKGYILTISQKGSHQWFFLTGLRPSAFELRSLFPSLPINPNAWGLPPTSLREINP